MMLSSVSLALNTFSFTRRRTRASSCHPVGGEPDEEWNTEFGREGTPRRASICVVKECIVDARSVGSRCECEIDPLGGL